MAVADFGPAAQLVTGQFVDSFAYRAARLYGIRGLAIAHEPGSRADLAQALQLLGASPGVRRLMRRRTNRLTMKMHVSCPRDDWEEVLGEVECTDEGLHPRVKDSWHRWKYFCTDGPITFHGHLFERQPGVPWVVAVRVSKG